MATHLDFGILQDLWHYAKAITGSPDSAFPSETLKQRLAAVEDWHYCVTCRLIEPPEELGLEVPGDFKTEKELADFGSRMVEAVRKLAEARGIDARTGDPMEPDYYATGGAR